MKQNIGQDHPSLDFNAGAARQPEKIPTREGTPVAKLVNPLYPVARQQ